MSVGTGWEEGGLSAGWEVGVHPWGGVGFLSMELGGREEVCLWGGGVGVFLGGV